LVSTLPRIRRSLTEEEAKKIAERHFEYTRGTIYLTGFAADISQYLGHKSYGLYSETAHKLAEKFIKKWEREGKLKNCRYFWKQTEKWK